MATVDFEHVGRKNKFLNKKKSNQYYFKKKKKPMVLVFDEKEREEFLSGFHKRKQARKKQAVETLEKEVKAERTRIRQEARNALKKLVVSFRDIPELENADEDTNVVDMGTHEVQITELNPDKLARENNWIGPNHARIEETDSKNNPSDQSGDEAASDEIEGMEINNRPKKNLKKVSKTPIENMKTPKDLKKYVKKLATKNVQKSKAFQKKKDVEARLNKKKKMREEFKKEKEIKNKNRRSKRNNRRN